MTTLYFILVAVLTKIGFNKIFDAIATVRAVNFNFLLVVVVVVVFKILNHSLVLFLIGVVFVFAVLGRVRFIVLLF